jgi:sugar-specific transcriptional regulator TrmB
MYILTIQNTIYMPKNKQIDHSRPLYIALQKLGFTDQESQLYLHTLSLGSFNAAELAEKLGISRPNIYKLVTNLETKGLIHIRSNGPRNKTYNVEPPSVVLEKLRQINTDSQRLERDVSMTMPDLLALYRQGDLPTSIKVFEGEAQFNKTFDLVLDEARDSMEFFGSAEDFIGFVSWRREHQFIKERIDNNIKVKALLLPGPDATALKLRDKDQLRETRLLKNIDDFPTSFQLFGNKVVIWQPKTPLGLLIADEYIVAMLRSMFNFMWEQSK